jgi:hypothetical protein
MRVESIIVQPSDVFGDVVDIVDLLRGTLLLIGASVVRTHRSCCSIELLDVRPPRIGDVVDVVDLFSRIGGLALLRE